MTVLTIPYASPIANTVRNIIVPNVTQSPNNIVISQLVPIITNYTFKWLYSALDIISGNISAGEIIANIKLDNTLKYSLYGKVGDNINYRIEPFIILGSVGIRITNLSINDLSVNLQKFKV